MPETNTEGARAEASRTRSPNYPAISLPEAIKRARQVYEKEHTHKTSSEVVAIAIGYNGLNGTSRSMTSALKKYGLLQADGDGLRVSSDAVDIFELPADDPISVEARRRAALKPPLFAEMKETYGDRLPSDANVRHWLIKKGFNPRMAADVIQLYKDTMESIAESGEAKPAVPANTPAGQQELGFEPNQTPPQQRVQQQTADSPNVGAPPMFLAPGRAGAPVGGEAGATETLQCRISGSSIARVLFEGVITQEAVKKLIAFLELSADNYPSKIDLERAKEMEQRAKELEQPKKEDVPAVQPALPLGDEVTFQPLSQPVSHPSYTQTGPAIWHAADSDREVTIVGYAGEKNGQHYLYTDAGAGVPANEVAFFEDEE